MHFIKHIFRRHRNELKAAGWAAIGFILIFCVLTLQLSATEDQSARRASTPMLHSPQAQTIPQSTNLKPQSLNLISKPASNQKVIVVQPSPFQLNQSGPVSRTSADANILQRSEPAYLQTDMIPDQATHPNAQYYHQEFVNPPVPSERTYTESPSMPRSNYFGVDPNDCCDEWSGFCGCSQKMFERWCRDCGSKHLRK